MRSRSHSFQIALQYEMYGVEWDGGAVREARRVSQLSKGMVTHEKHHVRITSGTNDSIHTTGERAGQGYSSVVQHSSNTSISILL